MPTKVDKLATPLKKLASLLFWLTLVQGIGCSKQLNSEELEYQPTFCSSPVPIDVSRIDSAEFAAVVDEVRKEFSDKSGISVVLFNKEHILAGYQSGPALDDLEVDKESAFYIASSTKSLVATTVLKLYEKGVVDLDTPIGQYLADLHFDSWLLSEDKITLRHLLTHDTGISSKALEIRTSITGEYDRSTLMRLYGEASGSFLTPQYSNLNYILTGLILEEVTGRTWQQLLATELFEPLGMERSFTYWPDALEQNIAVPHTMDANRNLYAVPKELTALRTNTLFPSGGVIASATDLARYVQLFLNCGEVNGKPFLSPETIELAVSPLAENKGGGLHEYFGFGLGWEIAKHDDLILTLHNGSNKVGARAYMGFAPDLGIGLVILLNENIVTPYVEGAIAEFAWDRLRDAQAAEKNLQANLDAWIAKADARFLGRMDGRQYPVFDYPSQSFPDVPLRVFEGTYTSDEYGTVKVSVQGDQLKVEYGNMVSQRVKRITADQFVGDFLIEAQQIEFDVSNGKATEVKFIAMGIAFERSRR